MKNCNDFADAGDIDGYCDTINVTIQWTSVMPSAMMATKVTLRVTQIERVIRYEDLTSSQTLGDPTSGIALTMSIVVGPLQAADWIYAANVGEDGRVYLAGYSGRVVEVTTEGSPVRAYDIGAVPRHIAETP